MANNLSLQIEKRTCSIPYVNESSFLKGREEGYKVGAKIHYQKWLQNTKRAVG